MKAKESNELVFNGKTLSLTLNSVLVDDVEMVPLQTIATLLGVTAPINLKSKPVSLKNERIAFEIMPGSTSFIINNNEYDLGIEPAIINNSVYIPADLIDIGLEGLIYYDRVKREISTSASNKLNADDSVISGPAGNAGKISYDVTKSSFFGSLVLVNKSNPISAGFVPSNMSGILDKNNRYVIPSKVSNVKLERHALDAAIAMFNAAKADRINNLVVSNGYRSFALQSTLHNRKISSYKKIYRSKDAVEKASSIVAPPGMSEHQTGLALDVTTKNMLYNNEPLSEGFASTPEGKWIYENSWKYGYIVRYPKDKTNITAIVYEPWHIRFVGLPHAEYMHKNKLCLEEYLAHIKKSGYIKYKSAAGIQYEIFYLNIPSSIDKFTLAYYGKEKYDISSYGKNGYIVTKRN